MIDPEVRKHLLAAFLPLAGAHLTESVSDVLLDTQVWEQCEALKDIRQPALCRRLVQALRRIEHGYAIDRDPPRIGNFETRNAIKHRSLAGSGVSEQNCETLRNLEGAVELKECREPQSDFGGKCVHALRGLDHQSVARRFTAYTSASVRKEKISSSAEVRAAIA